VPLISGNIDAAYFTSDATSGGDWCFVEWDDWGKLKKLHSSEAALDTSIHVRTIGTGARAASSSFTIPSCPAALYTALRTYLDGTAHHTLTLNHPQLGSKSYEVQVLSLVVPTQQIGQYRAGDPLANVTLRVAIFGVTP
jgi:hypothetical protein